MRISEFFKTHDWCQNTGARDATGKPVNLYDPSAVAWCVGGAAWKLGIELGAFDSWILYNDEPETTKEHLIAELERNGY